MAIKTQKQNPEGLHQRYSIKKADGSECDPGAVYFVLRLDKGGDDKEHVAACCQAARAYCTFAPKHMEKVAQELLKLVNCLDPLLCKQCGMNVGRPPQLPCRRCGWNIGY